MEKQHDMFILYAPSYLDEAVTRAKGGYTIVCLDFLLEQELLKLSVPFISLRAFLDSTTDEAEWCMHAQNISREWYRLPSMAFFQYTHIPLGEVVEPILAETYLTRLFYYLRLFLAFKKAYPQARVWLPATESGISLEEACLIPYERSVVTDAAHMARLNVTLTPQPAALPKRNKAGVSWRSLGVKGYNMLMSTLPRHPLRIHVHNYWSHIESVVRAMDHVELVFIDTGELKHIPWRQLFKHRIRFLDPMQEVSFSEIRMSEALAKSFVGKWTGAKKEVETYLAGVTKEDVNWDPLLNVFSYLMRYSSKTIVSIVGVRRILETEKPDVVLQLASVAGRYLYVFIVARIAAQLKIPSLELQHAAANLDPRLVFSRIETDYLATYGTHTNEWHERIGSPLAKLIATGSPRFDQYVHELKTAEQKGKELFSTLELTSEKPVLLVAIPFPATNLFYLDSYQLREFFIAIGEVQKAIPELQVLYKCRNDNSKDLVRRHLAQLAPSRHAIAGNEDIFSLLAASDAVVCGNSTLMFQTMLTKKPIILYPWKSFDTYNKEVYAPIAPIVHDTKEFVEVISRVIRDEAYRMELLARHQDFLKGYMLEGGSSKRVAELLYKLSRKELDGSAAPVPGRDK